jgi:hypothetical protein
MLEAKAVPATQRDIIEKTDIHLDPAGLSQPETLDHLAAPLGLRRRVAEIRSRDGLLELIALSGL